MPLVRIEIGKGRTREYKRAILDGVHAALIEAFRIPDHDRNQLLRETEPDCFEYGNGKTAQFTVVELTVFPGRSVEAKRRLYQAVVRNLEKAPGIPPTDVFIVLHEPPLQNWGLRGGRAACDLDLGFKVDV